MKRNKNLICFSLVSLFQSEAFIRDGPIYIAFKIGWNPQANSVHYGFGPGWVEIFLQISVQVNFDPVYLEFDSLGLNSW